MQVQAFITQRPETRRKKTTQEQPNYKIKSNWNEYKEHALQKPK